MTDAERQSERPRRESRASAGNETRIRNQRHTNNVSVAHADMRPPHPSPDSSLLFLSVGLSVSLSIKQMHSPAGICIKYRVITRVNSRQMAFYSLHFRDYCNAIDFYMHIASRIASGNFTVFEITAISTNVILPFNSRDSIQFTIYSNASY